jgi:hypothetical protein
MNFVPSLLKIQLVSVGVGSLSLSAKTLTDVVKLEYSDALAPVIFSVMLNVPDNDFEDADSVKTPSSGYVVLNLNTFFDGSTDTVPLPLFSEPLDEVTTVVTSIELLGDAESAYVNT